MNEYSFSLVSFNNTTEVLQIPKINFPFLEETILKQYLGNAFVS